MNLLDPLSGAHMGSRMRLLTSCIFNLWYLLIAIFIMLQKNAVVRRKFQILCTHSVLEGI